MTPESDLRNVMTNLDSNGPEDAVGVALAGAAAMSAASSTVPVSMHQETDGRPLTRTEVKRAERIERIERTAARLFATKGYEGTNFADIGAELDLRGSSLYHYFSSKDELFMNCLEHAAEQVFARLRSIVEAEHGDPLLVLEALVREQVLMEVRDFPEFVPLFFKMAMPSRELADRVLALRREHAFIFEQVAEDVRSRAGLERSQMRVWLGVAFGALAYLADWYDPAGELGVDQLAERMADTLVGQLRRQTG